MNDMDGRWQGGFNHLLQKRSSSDIKDQISTASLNFSITPDFRIVQLRSFGMAWLAWHVIAWRVRLKMSF